MPLVDFRDVVYEIEGKRILSWVNFQVETGETLVLLGRSGSGKSTALKLTNGMLFPTGGQILVDGRSTRDWDPIALKRRVGYVIQEVGLFPHFTVARNVGLVPRLAGWKEPDVERRIDELLGQGWNAGRRVSNAVSKGAFRRAAPKSWRGPGAGRGSASAAFR